MDHMNSALALKALDGLTARANITAENIANANTPAYRPLRVTFERALEQAAERGIDAVNALQPKVERETGSQAVSGVRLDLQLATASSTALRYAALIEILHRQSQLMSLAHSGNN